MNSVHRSRRVIPLVGQTAERRSNIVYNLSVGSGFRTHVRQRHTDRTDSGDNASDRPIDRAEQATGQRLELTKRASRLSHGTSHGRQRRGRRSEPLERVLHADADALGFQSKTVQHLAVLQHVHRGIEDTHLETVERAHTGTAERRPQANSSLHRFRQSCERVRHRFSGLRHRLNQWARGTQRRRQSATKRLRQLTRSGQQLGEHRRHITKRVEHRLEPTGHTRRKIGDACLRPGQQTTDVRSERTDRGTGVTEHVGSGGTQLIRRIANRGERATHVLLGVSGASSPRLQRLLEPHAVHRVSGMFHSSAESLKPVLLFGKPPVQAGRNINDPMKCGLQIAGLFDDLSHRLVDLTTQPRIVHPPGELFSQIGNIGSRTGKIRARGITQFKERFHDRFHTRHQVFDGLVHIREHAPQLADFVGFGDHLQHAVEHVRLKLSQLLHLRADHITYSIRELLERRGSLAIERVL